MSGICFACTLRIFITEQVSVEVTHLLYIREISTSNPGRTPASLMLFYDFLSIQAHGGTIKIGHGRFFPHLLNSLLPIIQALDAS
jgi:hypothetical protein